MRVQVSINWKANSCSLWPQCSLYVHVTVVTKTSANENWQQSVVIHHKALYIMIMFSGVEKWKMGGNHFNHLPLSATLFLLFSEGSATSWWTEMHSKVLFSLNRISSIKHFHCFVWKQWNCQLILLWFIKLFLSFHDQQFSVSLRAKRSISTSWFVDLAWEQPIWHQMYPEIYIKIKWGSMPYPKKSCKLTLRHFLASQH